MPDLTFKSAGAVTDVTAAGAWNVAQPALAAGDYCLLVMYDNGSTTPPTVAGYTYDASAPDGGLGAFHIFHRFVSTSIAATNVAVTWVGVGWGKIVVASGALPGIGGVAGGYGPNEVNGQSYWSTGSMSDTDKLMVSFGWIFAARTQPSLSNSGSITSTNTSRAFETISRDIGGRLQTTTSVVTSAAGGEVRGSFTGGAVDNVTLTLVFPSNPRSPRMYDLIHHSGAPAAYAAGKFSDGLNVTADLILGSYTDSGYENPAAAVPFTVEGWFRIGAVGSWCPWFQGTSTPGSAGGTTGALAFEYTGGVMTMKAVGVYGDEVAGSLGSDIRNDGLFHHCAWVLTDTTVSLYFDGNRVGTGSRSGIIPGHIILPMGGFRGLIDDVRVSSTARYTGPTYTVPTARHARDAYTTAIWRFDGTILNDPTASIPEGGGTGAYAWGPGTAGGARSSLGGGAAAYAWGPGSAGGANARAGGGSGAYLFGPATGGGQRESAGGGATSAYGWASEGGSGESSRAGGGEGAYSWGPATGSGAGGASGGGTGSYGWGVDEATGHADYSGQGSSSYSWGPAEGGGASAGGGGGVGSYAWGPGDAGGINDRAGGGSGAYAWGPGAAGGATVTSGGGVGSYLWGPGSASGRSDDGSACWPEMELVPVDASSALVPVPVGITLVPRDGTMMLVEDGCRM